MSLSFKEVPIVNCPKGGIHSSEQIQLICLDPICKKDNLCCIMCKKEKHQRHKTVLLKQLYEDINHKAQITDKGKSLQFQQNLEEVQQQVEQTFYQFKKYAIIKLQKYEDKMHEYFREMKLQNAKVKGLDVSGLKNESDPYLLQQQINSIIDQLDINATAQNKSMVNDLNDQYFSAERNHTSYNQFAQNFVQSLKQIHKQFSDEYKKILLFLDTGNEKLENIRKQHLSRNNSQLNISFSKLTPFQQTTESQFFQTCSPQQSQQFNYNDQLIQQQQQQQQQQQSQQILSRNNSQSQFYNPLQQSQQFSQQQQQPHMQQQDISQMNLSELSQKMSLYQPDERLSNFGGSQATNTDQQTRFLNRSFTPNESIASSKVYQNSLSKIRQDRSKSPAENDNRRLQRLQKIQEQKAKINQQQDDLQFKFSTHLKHLNIDVIKHKTVARATGDNNDTRMILLEPSIETRPLREIVITFNIVSCKNIAYSAPLAIGLCHQKQITANQFQFVGDDISQGYQPSISNSFHHHKNLSSSYIAPQQKINASSYQSPSSHGCYMISANGTIRNSGDPSQDMRKGKLRFKKGDQIKMAFNPFKKQLTFTRSDSNEITVLNNVAISQDKLHPCVRLSYSSDQVVLGDI